MVWGYGDSSADRAPRRVPISPDPTTTSIQIVLTQISHKKRRMLAQSHYQMSELCENPPRRSHYHLTDDEVSGVRRQV